MHTLMLTKWCTGLAIYDSFFSSFGHFILITKTKKLVKNDDEKSNKIIKIKVIDWFLCCHMYLHQNWLNHKINWICMHHVLYNSLLLYIFPKHVRFERDFIWGVKNQIARNIQWFWIIRTRRKYNKSNSLFRFYNHTRTQLVVHA